ncbi:MAG: hypothetical protein DRP08_04885, partial [Candidatus Aenigmatarchaeota archaeon]
LTHSSINSGSPIQIYCTGVTVTLNKKNSKVPNVNYDHYPADVITLSRENAKYVLTNSKIDVGDLSYALLLDLYNLEHDDDNPLILTVTYNNKLLTDSLGLVTDIPVTIDGALSVGFSTVDSRNAYQPTVNISLTEVFDE